MATIAEITSASWFGQDGIDPDGEVAHLAREREAVWDELAENERLLKMAAPYFVIFRI